MTGTQTGPSRSTWTPGPGRASGDTGLPAASVKHARMPTICAITRWPGSPVSAVACSGRLAPEMPPADRDDLVAAQMVSLAHRSQRDKGLTDAAGRSCCAGTNRLPTRLGRREQRMEADLRHPQPPERVPGRRTGPRPPPPIEGSRAALSRATIHATAPDRRITLAHREPPTRVALRNVRPDRGERDALLPLSGWTRGGSWTRPSTTLTPTACLLLGPCREGVPGYPLAGDKTQSSTSRLPLVSSPGDLRGRRPRAHLMAWTACSTACSVEGMSQGCPRWPPRSWPRPAGPARVHLRWRRGRLAGLARQERLLRLVGRQARLLRRRLAVGCGAVDLPGRGGGGGTSSAWGWDCPCETDACCLRVS